MDFSFKGKLNSINVVDRSTGIIAAAIVSCPLFETDIDALFKFMPAPAIDLTIGAGDKQITVFRCEMKSARESCTKEGTFVYVNFAGPLTERFSEKTGSVVGEQLDFMLSMNPEENQPALPDVGE